MRLLRHITLAACLLPAATLAAQPPRLTADIYSELVRYRAETGDVAYNTPEILRNLLQAPTSLYSGLIEAPALLNEVWWEDFVARVDQGKGSQAVISTLQWQLGLTKARPGIEIDVSDDDVTAYRSVAAAASAIKAGIDPDIFNQARDINPSRPTVAAHDAVGLQLLRDQMAVVPKGNWPAFAIEPSVLERYMRATTVSQISDDDDHYLASIVNVAARSGSTSQGIGGKARLPAAYRIARAAAAYKDSLGFFSEPGYCVGNDPSPRLPTDVSALEDHSPLCFMAATDRATLAWYREESRLQMSGLRIHENPRGTWQRAALILSFLMPVMDLAAFVEFIEAGAAEDVVEEEIVEDEEAPAPASSRAHRLACEVRAA